MQLLTGTQGIHVLLNNCPKLTHLSLTGVQAFLREEILAFCREAPPEFNDHQRDVFCVFSGNGVGRLRDFLNDQKAQQIATGSATPSQLGDGSDLGMDEDTDEQIFEAESGDQTPVLNISSQHPPGATPVVPGPPSTPSGIVFTNHLQNQTFWQNQHTAAGPSSLAHFLSQSAPAATGGALWSGSATAIHQQHHSQPPGPAGGAQHVTGMMAASALDDVDEGDEAFGEGSEIMGD